jgi:hypothetical protein
VQRGRRSDLEEAVGLQEQRQDGHEGLSVSPRDVHRVGGTAYETIAVSRECGQTIALRLGDLIKRAHANRQPDMRRPAKAKGGFVAKSKKKKEKVERKEGRQKKRQM